MAKMKKGKYIIGQGKDFKIKNPLPKNGIGYDNELYGIRWYIVDSTTCKVVGDYDNCHAATQCAIFLHKADELKLANEMDKLLRGE